MITIDIAIVVGKTIGCIIKPILFDKKCPCFRFGTQLGYITLVQKEFYHFKRILSNEANGAKL